MCVCVCVFVCEEVVVIVCVLCILLTRLSCLFFALSFFLSSHFFSIPPLISPSLSHPFLLLSPTVAAHLSTSSWLSSRCQQTDRKTDRERSGFFFMSHFSLLDCCQFFWTLGRERQRGSGELRKDRQRRMTEGSWRDLVNRFLIKMELKTHTYKDVCTHKHGCL